MAVHPVSKSVSKSVSESVSEPYLTQPANGMQGNLNLRLEN